MRTYGFILYKKRSLNHNFFKKKRKTVLLFPYTKVLKIDFFDLDSLKNGLKELDQIIHAGELKILDVKKIIITYIKL
tara:strand:+ start:2152 stop:2382 length:231 start_codon:yes stop_codon:yes gene_type:complete